MTAPKFHTLGAIQIPRGMVWVDEFAWSAVEKARSYSITGALIVDVAVKQAGRPITLKGDADAGWIARSAVLELRALADANPLAVHTLTLADGRSFTVQFEAGTPVEALPIARPELPADTHPHVATLRLFTV